MYRRFYTLGFLLVVLAALAGIYLARDLVGPVEVPRLTLLDQVAEAVRSLGLDSLLPVLGPATGSETEPAAASELDQRSVAMAPTRSREQPATGRGTPPGGERDAMAGAESPTDAPALSPPPSPTGDESETPAFGYAVAGELRHTTGDCPGPSIRGVVRSVVGEPLAGVRLWQYDQWGNEETTETRASEGDLGQYDFPLGDSANVYYVQIVDTSGFSLSPVVEVPHRQGTATDAECHWLDWVAR